MAGPSTREPKMYNCKYAIPILACVVIQIAGCATVDPRPDYDEVKGIIRKTTGRQEVFDPDTPPLSSSEISSVLADGLTLDEALRLALLNNQRLQAGFMRLGIGRAEYVQAGLLKNPKVSLAFLLPSGGGRGKLAVDLLEPIADLWQISKRKQFAKAELSQVVLEVSRFAGELVAETRIAYFESVAASELRVIAEAEVEVSQKQLEAVRRQVDSGVALATDANLAQSFALSTELAFRRAERQVVTTRRRLAALLSLEQDLQNAEFTDRIPTMFATQLDRESIVELSRATRLDVRAAEAAILSANAQIALEKNKRIPEFDAGVSVERPESGGSTSVLAGPALNLELPIFDQNQARVSQAEFRLRELIHEHQALVSEVAQEVRAAADRTRASIETARFVESELLPQAESSAVLAEKAYALGSTTILPLLESTRAVLSARQSRVESLLDAVLSFIDLERKAAMPLAHD
ncbi:MAG: TolC family protein [Planctomycetota bacterium]